VEIAPVVAELRAALLKVYAARDFLMELQVPAAARFTGDRADLLELLGNLLDNACKWCRSRVRVRAEPAGEGAPGLIRLIVEDDGDGVAEAALSSLGERGVRADERTPGHGIGLSMVRDTAEAYGGSLAVARSELGGLRVEVTLPGRL
jgi:signal transduction histidine kinase